MKEKRFWLAVGFVWLVLVFTDYLFYGLWLSEFSNENSRFWRTESQMLEMAPWLWVSQFLFSVALVWIYRQLSPHKNPWVQAFWYGVSVLFLGRLPDTISIWTTTSFSSALIGRWVVIAMIQVMLTVFVVALVYHLKKQRVLNGLMRLVTLWTHFRSIGFLKIFKGNR